MMSGRIVLLLKAENLEGGQQKASGKGPILELDNHILLGFQIAQPIYETAARYGLALEFIDVEALVVI